MLLQENTGDFVDSDGNATVGCQTNKTINLLRHLEGKELLHAAIKDVFKGEIAVSSSFGAESAILLTHGCRNRSRYPHLVY